MKPAPSTCITHRQVHGWWRHSIIIIFHFWIIYYNADYQILLSKFIRWPVHWLEAWHGTLWVTNYHAYTYQILWLTDLSVLVLPLPWPWLIFWVLNFWNVERLASQLPPHTCTCTHLSVVNSSMWILGNISHVSLAIKPISLLRKGGKCQILHLNRKQVFGLGR